MARDVGVFGCAALASFIGLFERRPGASLESGGFCCFKHSRQGGVFSQGYCLASVLWKALVLVKDSLHEGVVRWNAEGDGAKDVGVVGFEHC